MAGLTLVRLVFLKKKSNIVDTLAGVGGGLPKERESKIEAKGLMKLGRDRCRKKVYNTIPYINDRSTQ